MLQMSHVLNGGYGMGRHKCAIGKLTAGMSTRAVAREFNVDFSTISRLHVILEYLAELPTGLTTADHM